MVYISYTFFRDIAVSHFILYSCRSIGFLFCLNWWNLTS
nr:MAG TPA: hypothetical protein [Caudoviricetes sp.]